VRKIIFLPFPIFVLAEELEEAPILLPWLLGSLLLIGVFSWSIYKMIKTNNIRYGIVMVASLLLMAGLIFV